VSYLNANDAILHFETRCDLLDDLPFLQHLNLFTAEVFSRPDHGVGPYNAPFLRWEVLRSRSNEPRWHMVSLSAAIHGWCPAMHHAWWRAIRCCGNCCRCWTGHVVVLVNWHGAMGRAQHCRRCRSFRSGLSHRVCTVLPPPIRRRCRMPGLGLPRLIVFCLLVIRIAKELHAGRQHRLAFDSLSAGGAASTDFS